MLTGESRCNSYDSETLNWNSGPGLHFLKGLDNERAKMLAGRAPISHIKGGHYCPNPLAQSIHSCAYAKFPPLTRKDGWRLWRKMYAKKEKKGEIHGWAVPALTKMIIAMENDADFLLDASTAKITLCPVVRKIWSEIASSRYPTISSLWVFTQ